MLARVAKYSGWILAIIVLAIIAFAVWTIASKWQEATTVRIGKSLISATIADNDKEREKGLGEREKIGVNEGMLFIYDHDGRWTMWMKDMHFSIDIIWLDSEKHIVHIVKNVSPSTYPETFAPDRDARYVLEVPAGTVDEAGIQIDQHADFEVHER